MSTTVHVVGFSEDERAWIESALGRVADALVFVDDGEAFLARPPADASHCLIASADVDEAATLRLVRELRRRGVALPVIVLGPHSAFRTAVDIARLESTDFLARPVSVRELRAAVRRVHPDPK
ncbi:hypothetical protein [Variovorax saccharolyticus]|uniref:hypothetical protein n=1 Tax=Variovorax saccharolyticus TaxID=3053516 RepID=UPI002576B26B|nr:MULTISPECIES: hypothetical protein [unclassified Variovorax]MDM0021394.1 hypothetical protein [Variovorax sp. J22R187]MDM0027403.1 hypothetical protein [Variovorax sp. J31P216]